MSENKASYYAIIPANVRYDSELIPSAKLLYGEITALCNKEGYCWASNSYFSELYGVSITTIKNWLKSLEDGGYIDRQVKYKEGSKEIDTRWITIVAEGRQENLPRGRQEKCPDNNTSFNTTVNNTSNKDILSGKAEPRIPFKEIIDYLNEKTGSRYKHTSKKTQSLIKARFNDGFTLDDFKKVIDIKTDEWKDTDMSKFLRPETLFGTKFESYLNQKQINKEPKEVDYQKAFEEYFAEQKKPKKASHNTWNG